MKLHSWGNPTKTLGGSCIQSSVVSQVTHLGTQKKRVQTKIEGHGLISWKGWCSGGFLNKEFWMVIFWYSNVWGLRRLHDSRIGLTTWNNLGKARPKKAQSKQEFFCVEFQAKNMFSNQSLEIHIQIYPTKSKGQSIPTLQHQWTGDGLQSVCFSMALSSMLKYSSYFSRSNGGIITAWSSRMYSHPSTHQDLPFNWSTAGYGGYWEDNNLHPNSWSSSGSVIPT